MASDLEANLVNGGISPAAAKVIANAIANASSAKLSLGRAYGDATPRKQLRMVDADTRKYLLTNIDHPVDATFARTLKTRGNSYQPRDTSHPYDGSQPATAQPTLTEPSVKDGDYISVASGTKDSVVQSSVGLRVTQKGGTHARLNQATKAIEAVPFLIENDQEQFIEATFEERPEATVLKLRLRNLHQLFSVDITQTDLITAVFEPTATGTSLKIRLPNIAQFTGQNGGQLRAWTT
jgi:hypothetical protein